MFAYENRRKIPPPYRERLPDTTAGHLIAEFTLDAELLHRKLLQGIRSTPFDSEE
jgi:hypothetical protein